MSRLLSRSRYLRRHALLFFLEVLRWKEHQQTTTSAKQVDQMSSQTQGIIVSEQLIHLNVPLLQARKPSYQSNNHIQTKSGHTEGQTLDCA